MGQIGKGTTVGHGAIDGTDIALIPNVSDVNFPDSKRNAVKDSNYTTPDGVHGYIPGWIEGGTVEVTVDFDPAHQDSLQGLLVLGRENWEINVVDPAGNPVGTESFEGFVTAVGGALPNEEKCTCKFTIQCCTLSVFTPAA